MMLLLDFAVAREVEKKSHGDHLKTILTESKLSVSNNN